MRVPNLQLAKGGGKLVVHITVVFTSLYFYKLENRYFNYKATLS